ncbi:hypothetical protein PPERSA_09263 [Pseudocohnilembus persalinus]|uniref:Transmembrane protein n=1 Tax=Pseudocohnilembus persalinus TaxID=266149 RepID=A0A0V0QLP9_PSEPJ|nr:hypothetical protein PPERSA_09263 [Pseudocohnilembus persalinus]|eukprot:KRX03251.1 hypothetical protein PPERSA_09263 [Pseudocohnilembus persalinus]
MKKNQKVEENQDSQQKTMEKNSLTEQLINNQESKQTLNQREQQQNMQYIYPKQEQDEPQNLSISEFNYPIQSQVNNPPIQQKQVLNKGKDKNENNNNDNDNDNNNPFQKEVDKVPLLRNLKLPKLVKFDFRGQDYQILKEKKMPKPLIEGHEKVAYFLDSTLENWDVDNYTQIDFGLPDTIFKGDKPVIQYNEPTYEVERLELGQLSAEQRHSIWNNGTFIVPSKKFSTPYTWQLTQWLVKGRKNIKESFYYDMSNVYHISCFWGDCFYAENQYEYEGFRERTVIQAIFKPQLFDSLKEIFWHFPKRLWNLFLGYPVFRQQNKNLQQYDKIIEIERNDCTIFVKNRELVHQSKLDIKFYEVYSQFYNYANFIEQEEKNFLDEIWDKKLKDKYTKELNQEDIDYDQKLFEIKHSEFINYLRQLTNKPIEDDVFESLIRKIAEYEIDLESKLKKEHYIRKYSYKFIQDKLEQLRKQNRKKEINQMDDNIMIELESQNLAGQLHVFKSFIQYLRKEEDNFDKKREEYSKKQQVNKFPIGQYSFSAEFFFPKIQYKEKQKIYQEVNYEYYNTDSSSWFWRFKVYWVRYKGIYKTLTEMACYGFLHSSISFRAIFSCKTYHPIQHLVNAHTGEKKYKNEKVDPIKVLMTNLWDNIKTDRKKFEEIPDTAFFGKNIGRICNILYNYMIKLFFGGFLGLLILFPILCIVLSSLCIVLVFTSWFWTFLALLIQFIIIIILYDFDEPYQHHEIPFGVRLLPIISISFKLVFKGVLQLAMSFIYIFGIVPLLAIFMALFGFSRYILRSLYDCFMYGIVRCFARNPVREDNMAWRIKGPGVENTQYYYTIEDNDVFMLVRAELEKLQLLEFEYKAKRIIKKPLSKAQKIYRDCLEIYQVTRKDQFNQISNKVNIINNKLTMAIQQRQQCFPYFNSQQVRFSDQELERLLPITTEIIYGFIQEHQMNYVWRLMGIKKDDFKTLTDKIWQRIFKNYDILEGLSDDEQQYRHEINRVRDDSIIKDIAHTMNVQQYNASTSKWKRSMVSQGHKKAQKKKQMLAQYQLENLVENEEQKQQIYQQECISESEMQQVAIKTMHKKAREFNKKKLINQGLFKQNNRRQNKYLEDNFQDYPDTGNLNQQRKRSITKLIEVKYSDSCNSENEIPQIQKQQNSFRAQRNQNNYQQYQENRGQNLDGSFLQSEDQDIDLDHQQQQQQQQEINIIQDQQMDIAINDYQNQEDGDDQHDLIIKEKKSTYKPITNIRQIQKYLTYANQQINSEVTIMSNRDYGLFFNYYYYNLQKLGK